ncbi:MAG: HEAT repeat domain-containing protein [bacterium]
MKKTQIKKNICNVIPEVNMKRINAKKFYEIIYRHHVEIRELIGSHTETIRNHPKLQNRLNRFNNIQQERIKNSLRPVLSQRSIDYPTLMKKITELMVPAFFEGELKRFWSATETKERLARLQHISQMVNWIDDRILKDLAKEALSDKNPAIRGEMCYALGRTAKTRFKRMISPLLDGSDPWVREQATNAIERLKVPEGTSRDEIETEVLLSELSEIRKRVEEEALLRAFLDNRADKTLLAPWAPDTIEEQIARPLPQIDNI